MKNLILALAIPFAALTSAPAFAGSKCSPDIKVVNTHDHGVSIKVTKVEYRLKGTDVWHIEDVSNTILSQKGGSHTFKSQSLGSAVKGSKLDWRVLFEKDTGSGYGSEQTSQITYTTSIACENDVTYTVDAGPQ